MYTNKEFFKDFTVSVDDIYNIILATETEQGIEASFIEMLKKNRTATFYRTRELGGSLFVSQVVKVCEALYVIVKDGNSSFKAKELIKRYIDDHTNLLEYDKEARIYFYNANILMI
jgi:hypothetical protein